MDEMFGYVFGKLRVTEDALRKVGNVMKSQNVINKKLAIGIMLSGIGFIMTAAIIQMQDDKIKQLSAEIEKLKESTESTEGDTESEK